jgi:hypothetical protein
MDVAGVAFLLSMQVALSLSAAGQVRTESRGGLLPVFPGAVPQAAFDLELTPRAGLTLEGRMNSLSIGYAGRMLRRFSRGLGEDILVLHGVDAAAEQSIGRSLNLRLLGGFRTGEADYAFAPTLLGGAGGTSSAPAAAIILMQSIDAMGVISYQLDRRQTIALEGRLAKRDPIGAAAEPEPGEEVGARIVALTTVGADLSYRLRLRSGTELGLSASVATLDSDIGRASRNVALFSSVSHRFATWLEVNGRVGAIASALAPLEDGGAGTPLPPGATEGGLNVGTLGGGSVRFMPVDNRRLRLSLTMSGSLEPAANPALGIFEPRLTVGGRVGVDLGTTWSTGVEATFASPLNFVLANVDPLTGIPVATALVESILSVTVPVRRRFLDDQALEAGLRVGAFGPRLSNPDFVLGNWSVVGYLAVDLTAQYGSARRR